MCMMLIGTRKLAAACALAVVLLLYLAAPGDAALHGFEEAGGGGGGGVGCGRISLTSRQKKGEGRLERPTKKVAGAGGQERRWVMKDRRRGSGERSAVQERSRKRRGGGGSAQDDRGDDTGRRKVTPGPSPKVSVGGIVDESDQPSQSSLKARIVLHPRKLCAHPECELLASFGPANATAFFATHCSRHKLPGHRNIRDKLCQHMEVSPETQHRATRMSRCEHAKNNHLIAIWLGDVSRPSLHQATSRSDRHLILRAARGDPHTAAELIGSRYSAPDTKSLCTWT